MYIVYVTGPYRAAQQAWRMLDVVLFPSNTRPIA